MRDAIARWDRRYREDGPPTEPSRLLVDLDPILPRRGRALDVAGGAGRHAVWLADRGLDVCLVDASPVAIELARRAAAAAGVELRLEQADLTRDALPPGPWDLVLVFHYLQRDLFPALGATLAPGGLFVAAIATRRNLDRHERPPAEYLLDEGEAPALVPDLEILRYDEGWLAEGRHDALLVATRAAHPGSGR